MVLYTPLRGTYSGAAMNSQVSGSSTYRSLAQQRAVIVRQFDGALLPRLAMACRTLRNVDVRLAFDRDDHGRVVVKGSAGFDAGLGCHRCEEVVMRRMKSEFAALIAFNEDQATAWADMGENTDIIVVASSNLDVVELVEDELLLTLPDRVCLDDKCRHMPSMYYSADDTPNVEISNEEVVHGVDEERRFPFAGLKDAMEAEPKKPKK